MDREGFRNRLKQYKEAKGFNPQLQYWEWKQQYDAAPQPDSMPKQPTSDKKTKQPKEVENISHRADNPHTVLGREPYDSPYDDSRYWDFRKPRFEFRKGDVHYGNPNVLKWMGRFGKVLRGGSLLGEVVQNLFPSEEAELIEDLRVKMDKQNKWLTRQEDIPTYDEGGKVIPTQEEYITQQIAAERAAALKKSYDRKYPRVPTSGGKRSKADWENSLNQQEEYLNTLLSRWGITPSQKTIWQNNLKALQSQREAGYDAYIGEGKILGPSCAYTTGDNYGIDCISSEQFRQNHADYGFREIPYNQVQPSDVVLDYNPEEQRATHTMMYSKKGSDGVARFNHSNGGHTAEAIRKDARYPFKGHPLAYEFVGTPADSTQWISDYKKLYGLAEGGEVGDEVTTPIVEPVLPESYDPYYTQWQANWLNNRREQLYNNLNDMLYKPESWYTSLPEHKFNVNRIEQGIVSDLGRAIRGYSPERIKLNQEFYRQINNAATAPEETLNKSSDVKGEYYIPNYWNGKGHYIVYSKNPTRSTKTHERSHAANAKPQERAVGKIIKKLEQDPTAVFNYEKY